MRALVYFHVYTDTIYESILKEMMDIMQSSGLLHDIIQLRACITGSEVQRASEIISSYPNTVIHQSSQHSGKEFERFTLHRMHHDCSQFSDDHFILYIHSKGVSRKSQKFPGVAKWRRIMLQTLALYRHVAWTHLAYGADIFGLFFRNKPSNHFSGNFWWSRSAYIRTLPMPIGSRYLDPEMWITRMATMAVSLSQFPGCLYHCPIDEDSFHKTISVHTVLGDEPLWIIPWDRVVSVRFFYGTLTTEPFVPTPSDRISMPCLGAGSMDDPAFEKIKTVEIIIRNSPQPLWLLENTCALSASDHHCLVVPADNIDRIEFGCSHNRIRINIPSNHPVSLGVHLCNHNDPCYGHVKTAWFKNKDDNVVASLSERSPCLLIS